MTQTLDRIAEIRDGVPRNIVGEYVLLREEYEDLEEEARAMSKVESESYRSKCLNEAMICVCGDIENQYGSPENNFATIAALWSCYFGKTFTAHDVAIMMALLKVARIKTGTQTWDSYVDLAGYAACAAEIAKDQKGGSE